MIEYRFQSSNFLDELVEIIAEKGWTQPKQTVDLNLGQITMASNYYCSVSIPVIVLNSCMKLFNQDRINIKLIN